MLNVVILLINPMMHLLLPMLLIILTLKNLSRFWNFPQNFYFIIAKSIVTHGKNSWEVKPRKTSYILSAEHDHQSKSSKQQNNSNGSQQIVNCNKQQQQKINIMYSLVFVVCCLWAKEELFRKNYLQEVFYIYYTVYSESLDLGQVIKYEKIKEIYTN